jgi:serine protease Do
MLSARLVGADAGSDLALLKVEGSGLPHLPVDASVKVRQGELVFAVGSPQGLSSTITMGVVGAPGREVQFAQPIAYIQTDAPINPGNSGGPLVNVDGALAGINTFIVSQSGGSQGLGFAIPAGVVKAVVDSLRASGLVRRIDTGVTSQSISPALAAGLGLPRDWGVVVSDVTLAGAARRAGVQVGDVIDTFDGHPIDSLASLTSALYLHVPGKPVVLGVLRGAQRLTLEVQAPEARQPADQLVELANPEKGMVRRLGIVGVDVSPKLAGIIPPLLIAKGVVVAARTLDGTSAESGLQPGDVIHSLNRSEIDSVEGLRQALRGVAPGAPVALQIERAGKLAWLAFELE